MTEGVASASNIGSMSDAEKLCSILLEVAGRDTNRLPSVKRHVRALDAALPYMTSAQAELARARIKHHEIKWGSLLPGHAEEPEKAEISPVSLITRWLSVRRAPSDI